MGVSNCRIAWCFTGLLVVMCLGVNDEVAADQTENSQESSSVTYPPYNRQGMGGYFRISPNGEINYFPPSGQHGMSEMYGIPGMQGR